MVKTVGLPDEIWNAAKSFCKKNGYHLSAWVGQVVMNAIEEASIKKDVESRVEEPAWLRKGRAS